MRRIFILAALSGLMLLLPYYNVQTDSIVEPKSLAAFGFVLLAAFILGEFAALVKLPRVTGYLVTGVAAGPSAANFFSASVVDELELMNSLAVGLIALTAGGELRMKDLKKNIRAIMIIIGIQLVIILPLVTLVFGFGSPYLFDWSSVGLDSPATGFLIALGAMFGALAVGNSPAVSVAIVNDTGSKGPFTNLNLGVTITKDLVVVVVFSVITAVSISQLNPEGQSLMTAMGGLGLELGKSLLVGAAIGFFLVAWMRWVDEETMLVLVGVVFVGMWLGDVLHLEKILVFLVAGFIVENVSEHGHDMIHSIERVSPPVYVVFFAVAGANLDLPIIAQMFWLGLAIVLFRIAGMLVATNLGARLSGLPPLYQRSLGVGFFSQAGVTLGLVLIASGKLDGIDMGGVLLGSDVFTPMMMAVVALNLGVGPVFLKVSLAASGETAEQRGASVDERHMSEEELEEIREAAAAAEQERKELEEAQRAQVEGTPDETDAEEALEAARAGAMFPPPLAEAPVQYQDEDLGPELNRSLKVVREGIEDSIENFRWNFLEPSRADGQLVVEQLRQHTRQAMDELVTRTEKVTDAGSLRQWLRKTRVGLAESYYALLLAERGQELESEFDDSAFEQLWTQIQDIPDELPKAVSVDEHEDLFAPNDNDGPILSLRKWFSRKRRNITGLSTRVVPIRRLVEFHVSGPFPTRAIPIANMAGHQRFYFWRKVSHTTRYVDGVLCDMLLQLDDPLLVDARAKSLPQPEDEKETEDEREQRLKVAVRRIRERLPTLQKELSEEFKFVVDDLNTYADELAARLRNRLVVAYTELAVSSRTAGTYLLPDRKINTSKIYDKYREGIEEIRKSLENWRTASLGFSGRHLTVLDIIDLQHVAFGRVAEAKIEIANALLNDLRPIPAAMADRMRAALSRISHALAGDEVDPEDALPVVEAMRATLGGDIGHAIERLESLRDRGRFVDLLDEFTRHLAEDCMRLTTMHDVLEVPPEELSEARTPPALQLKTLPLRDLARELLSGEVAVKLAAVNGIVSASVELVISGLSDVQRVVSFNLEAAASELRTGQQSDDTEIDPIELAREFAEGALQRSVDRLQEMLDGVDSAELQIGDMIESQTLRQLQRMREMAIEGNVSAIKNYLAQRSLEERGHEAASGIRGFFIRTRKLVKDNYETIVQPNIEMARHWLSVRLGIAPPPDVPTIELTDEATFPAVQKNEAIPATYRRLFSPAPVEVDEFFVGRSPETEALISAFERFDRGLNSSVLIHSELGNGKTSFIDHALGELNTTLPVERMSISHNFENEHHLAVVLGDLLDQQTRNLNRLRGRLRNIKRKRIIVIEGLHNFYLRTLDGFEALQRFLLLVSETSHVFFWVVSVNSDAFRYLRNVINVDDHFTRVIGLNSLGRSDIKRIIEARHNVSGFDLQYDHRVEGEPARSFLFFGEPSQQQLESEYFDGLAEHSRGNITLALYYWLRSLDEVTDQKTIRIKPFRPLETRFIAEMATEKQLALGAIITHGGLSVRDFSKVFRITEDEARGLLTRLVHFNLLTVEPGHVDTYRLNPVLYRTIADVLRERHIL